ncbi:MAG: UDP-N-acetylmuramoyl-L-alanine--D-glutamate ligase [Candidatus Margulisiibacteriota bacterium]
MINLQAKNVTVFGAGISGLACCEKLKELGAKPFLTELRPIENLPSDISTKILSLGIEYELGGHSQKAIDSAEMIVVSPGIHLDLPILEKAKQKKIPIMAEIELAYQLLNKPIIAITGTNGKTTTTTLIGEMLIAAGKRVAVVGNIGSPIISVDDSNLDYIVAEISSYQLEGITDFKPFISVICNIQEDHIERHHSMDEYIAQKARIYENQSPTDFLVYNGDDPLVSQMAQKAKCITVPFSKSNITVLGIEPKEIKIPGKHNLENALAAATAVSLCDVDIKQIAKVLQSFPGVEHRIEFVRELDGIKFYNDSKATNPASTLVALETFANKPLVLLLGGKEKGVSIDEMCQRIKETAKEVILIGEAAAIFKSGLERIGFNNIKSASFSMSEAVKMAFADSKPGDIVLLSPACASFDMFNNYEERGRAFKKLVNQL